MNGTHMLMPHPAVLRRLVERYETLRRSPTSTPEILRQREDAAYTLCVSTGTRDIDSALTTARRYLARPPGTSSAA